MYFKRVEGTPFFLCFFFISSFYLSPLPFSHIKVRTTQLRNKRRRPNGPWLCIQAYLQCSLPLSSAPFWRRSHER
jgi:hypothetical protein